MAKKKNKVLLVGWDAADWKIIDKMMEAENVFVTFREFEKLRPGTVSAWVTSNPDKWKIVTTVNGW